MSYEPKADDQTMNEGTAHSESPESEAMDEHHSTSTPETVEEAVAEADLDADLSHLEDELQRVNDQHLRLAAEFTNYRKRVEQEMTESWVRAQADLVRRLLETLDDLQRVGDLERDATTVDGVLDGVLLVERKFLRVMEEVGMKVIEPADQPFDPASMEALMSVPTDDPDEDETVGQVIQKGYAVKGHLIRPARVSVRKYEAGE